MHLQNPDRLAIDDSYRRIKILDGVTFIVDVGRLENTLKDLEETGFVGMTIFPFSPSENVRKIEAFKGKHGPCYDTGRRVIYTGAALAVLDDDHHMLIAGKPLPVCEKTANVLSLPVYETVIETIMTGKENHPDSPEYFRYDNMEEDQEILLKKVKGPLPASDRIPLFYPGPFKLLILSDGTLVRRGKISDIPLVESKKLVRQDHLFNIVDKAFGTTEFYQDLYRRFGPRWIFQDFKVENRSEHLVSPDFSRLNGISKNIRDKILRMIRDENEYFILTGSDPIDHLGCCPSQEVAEANKLVRAGILESCSQTHFEDACPVTIYAFQGEMKEEKQDVKFQPDPDFRRTVLNKLNARSDGSLKKTIRWALLAFVFLSVFIGIYKIAEKSHYADDQNLYEQLMPTEDEQLMILLFHYHKRCLQCLNLEIFTRDVLNTNYEEEIASNRILFRMIDMDAPEYRGMVKQFGFISAMIVLVEFKNGDENEVKVVEDAWKFFDDEQNYKALIRKEINQFISEGDE